MAPPYRSYAATTGPVLLRGGAGPAGEQWSFYSVLFYATDTGTDGHITWWLEGDMPDNADIWLGGASLLQVVPVDPNRLSFDSDV
jgi:hypothetical protein